MRIKYLICMLAAVFAFGTGVASAVPLTLDAGFYFRENRGVNDIGSATGDRIVYGANVTPNGAGGTTATRAYTNPAGGVQAALPFNPNTDFPNQFSNAQVYTAARAGGVTLSFINGPDTASLTFGSLLPELGITGPMPLATGLGVTGIGSALTFHWTAPNLTGLGLNIERVQILVYDLEAGGDRIFAEFLGASATSFDTVAGGLNLLTDHDYAFGIRLEDLHNDPTLSGGAARLSSSQTYFSFTTSVPEPASLALLALGLLGLGFSRRTQA